MSKADEGTPSRRPGIDLYPGMGVILRSQYWLLEKVTSTEVLLRRGPTLGTLGREETRRELVVSAEEFIDAVCSTGSLLMDSDAAASWPSYEWKDQVRWNARLKIVHLFTTGYALGHPGVAGPGEPIEGLQVHSGAGVTERVRILNEWLGQGSRAARQILFDLEARQRRESGNGELLKFHSGVPKTTMLRWVEDFGTGGVWGLMDGRANERNRHSDSGKRRTDTIDLIKAVLADRTDATSQHSDAWVIREVKRRAAQGGIALMGKTVLAELVAQLHKTAGRTPSQKKTAAFNDTRLNRQTQRTFAPGTNLAWDATTTHVLVRLTPNGPALNAHIHIAVCTTTGLILSVYATARYSAANVLLMAYDAFRPLWIPPGPGDAQAPRFQDPPKNIVVTDRVSRLLRGEPPILKPGVIPANIKCDNGKQNHALPMMAMMREYGATLSPSPVGRKTGNTHAENAIGIAANYLEELPAYVGRNTVERGRKVEEAEPPLLLEELNALLRRKAFIEHNNAPATAPLVAKSGISRLAHWDTLLQEYGPPPHVRRPHEYYNFLPRKTVTRTPKGVALLGERFDARCLWGLPDHVVGPDRRLEIIYDPRRLDCVWVQDRKAQAIHRIDNVLRDLTRAPLVESVRREAMRRSNLRHLKSAGNRRALVLAMEQIYGDDADQTVAVQRDLADYRLSDAIHRQAVGEDPANGADHGGSPVDDPVRVDLDRRLPLRTERS